MPPVWVTRLTLNQFKKRHSARWKSMFGKITQGQGTNRSTHLLDVSIQLNQAASAVYYSVYQPSGQYPHKSSNSFSLSDSSVKHRSRPLFEICFSVATACQLSNSRSHLQQTRIQQDQLQHPIQSIRLVLPTQLPLLQASQVLASFWVPWNFDCNFVNLYLQICLTTGHQS